TDVAAASNVPIANLVVQNGLGNSNSAFSGNDTPAGAADAIDANSPYVVSINRATTTNVWSTTSGISAASIKFHVIFSENIDASTISAADFALVNPSSIIGATIGVPVATLG